MKLLALVMLIAACGDNLAGPDAPVIECGVALTGNIDETSTGPDICPMLIPGVGDNTGHTTLAFLIPSPALHTSLGIRIDLGPAPSAGDYSSTTTGTWSAIAVKPVPPRGGCVFNAGNESSPSGHFLLRLDTVEPPVAHGSLALTLFVLPQTSEQGGTQTECGTGTTEDVGVRF